VKNIEKSQVGGIKKISPELISEILLKYYSLAMEIKTLSKILISRHLAGVKTGITQEYILLWRHSIYSIR
jgi:hypothetical protein